MNVKSPHSAFFENVNNELLLFHLELDTILMFLVEKKNLTSLDTANTFSKCQNPRNKFKFIFNWRFSRRRSLDFF